MAKKGKKHIHYHDKYLKCLRHWVGVPTEVIEQYIACFEKAVPDLAKGKLTNWASEPRKHKYPKVAAALRTLYERHHGQSQDPSKKSLNTVLIAGHTVPYGYSGDSFSPTGRTKPNR